jgi:ABC-type dipeptide/oligopeptide/nickel transport system permease component
MIRTVLRGVSLLAALSWLVFAISEWAPGDSVSLLRMSPEYSPATLEAVRSRLGLAESWGARYGQWLGSVLAGDFGRSLTYEIPVAALLRGRWEATARLNAISTLAAWALALPLGCWLASRSRGWARLLSESFGAIVLALPEMLLALLGLWWFGGGGVLPYAVLTLGALPVLTSHVSRCAGSALRESAVEASRLHGIRGLRLWWSYILPLAAPPLISLC